MIKLWLRIFLNKFFEKFLPKTGQDIYIFFADFIKKKIHQQLPDDQIWFRNSFIENRISPFLSDLDISIYCKTFQKTVTTLKKYPLQGESNLILKEDLPIIAQAINPYELKRDPTLLTLIKQEGYASLLEKKKGPVQIEAEKNVFLFRMLHSDWMALQQFPSARQKKWQGHFQDLKIPMNSDQKISAFQVLKLILDNLKLNDLKEFEIVTKAIFTIKRQGQLEVPNKAVWLLYYNWSIYKNLTWESLTDIEIEVVKAQTHWEIFAWCTQRHFFPNFDNHLSLIKKSLITLDAKLFADEIKLINEILSRSQVA